MRRGRAVGFVGLLFLAVLVASAPVARAGDEDKDEVGKLEFHGYGEVHYNNPRIDTMSSLEVTAAASNAIAPCPRARICFKRSVAADFSIVVSTILRISSSDCGR